MKKRSIHPTNVAGDHLYRQVEEQSDYCDVLIQVGIWERRYHWCVLTASPFFEAVYRHNLTERKTGVVTIGIGSSVAVEKVLRFMYDQKVEVTEGNVVSVLEVADFLFLEKVRKKCIEFLKSLVVNESIFFHIHRASVLFNFDIPILDTYWDENILNIISWPEVLDIQKEPLKEILLDESNRCISKELFDLIVRWVTAHSTSDRKQHFTELFLCLDISLIDLDFLEHTVKQNSFVQTNTHCQEKVASFQWRGEENVNVIVTEKGGTFYCLCPEDGRISILGSFINNRVWTCNHDAMTQIFAFSSDRKSLIRFDITTRTSITRTVTSDVTFWVLLFANESLYGLENTLRPETHEYKQTLYQLVDTDDGTSVEAIPILSFNERVNSACSGPQHVLFFQTPINVITYNTITCTSVVHSIPVHKYIDEREIGTLTSNETGGCFIPVQQSNRYQYINLVNGQKGPYRPKWIEIPGNPTETEQAALVRIRSVPPPPKGQTYYSYSEHPLLISADQVMIITPEHLQLFSRKTSHEWSLFDLSLDITSPESDAVFTTLQRKHLACCFKCPHKAQPEHATTSGLDNDHLYLLAMEANEQYGRSYSDDNDYADYSDYEYYN